MELIKKKRDLENKLIHVQALLKQVKEKEYMISKKPQILEQIKELEKSLKKLEEVNKQNVPHLTGSGRYTMNQRNVWASNNKVLTKEQNRIKKRIDRLKRRL